jgi:hypothetical protein
LIDCPSLSQRVLLPQAVSAGIFVKANSGVVVSDLELSDHVLRDLLHHGVEVLLADAPRTVHDYLKVEFGRMRACCNFNFL